MYVKSGEPDFWEHKLCRLRDSWCFTGPIITRMLFFHTSQPTLKKILRPVIKTNFSTQCSICLMQNGMISHNKQKTETHTEQKENPVFPPFLPISVLFHHAHSSRHYLFQPLMYRSGDDELIKIAWMLFDSLQEEAQETQKLTYIARVPRICPEKHQTIFIKNTVCCEWNLRSLNPPCSRKSKL